MSDIDVLLQEHRRFPPPEAFRRTAHVASADLYEKAGADPEAFWAGCAEALDWIKPWSRVLEWSPPKAKWFTGGQMKVSEKTDASHTRTARRKKAGLIREGEPGDR